VWAAVSMRDEIAVLEVGGSVVMDFAEFVHHFRRERVEEFRIGETGRLHRNGVGFVGPAVVIPDILRKSAAGADDAEGFVFERADLSGKFAHFGDPERCAVGEFEEGDDVAEVVVTEE